MPLKSFPLVPLIACITLMAAATPVLAENAPVVTHHVLKIGKATMPYAAAFTETELKNASGQPVVTLSAISYVLDGMKGDATRPVVFFFNGGPGASSSPLHMSAFGPRIRSEGKDAHIVDNPNTLLDSADLVFIDPVGTGLSHTFQPDEVGQFLGVDHDAAAVLMVITNWLRSNNREISPVFIAGESYGGTRLAVMAGQIADRKTPIRLKGVLLISPALDFSTSADMTQVLQLPTLAAGAWYHQKIDRKARSLTDFVALAQSFAINTYAPALIKGAALGETERTFVAKELAGFTGLPADLIAKANLRIDSEVFLSELNAAQNLDTGRLDMRVTAIKAPPLNTDRPAAANDPSLGLGKSNVITSPVITAYLRDELKVSATSDYVSLSLDLNFRWNWSDVKDEQKFALNVTPDLARLLKDRPDVRVMVVGGYYDLATPLWSARYAIEHSDAPLDRVRFEAYPTGHSVFNPADDLSAKADQIRTFLTPQP